jgi:hypothetical protein
MNGNPYQAGENGWPRSASPRIILASPYHHTSYTAKSALLTFHHGLVQDKQLAAVVVRVQVYFATGKKQARSTPHFSKAKISQLMIANVKDSVYSSSNPLGPSLVRERRTTTVSR